MRAPNWPLVTGPPLDTAHSYAALRLKPIHMGQGIASDARSLKKSQKGLRTAEHLDNLQAPTLLSWGASQSVLQLWDE
ncbi:hypothetical protein NDU88_006411 [Pleurodeles waltl]|uniref:Uncharacterized protein n=1 Tax=Pleurodeles waltl TaxID=8319 RepID=A0AAV7WXI8_PLEWA|nr:hypothetical protein NDU88_006411 [Pleurodeles waltl]